MMETKQNYRPIRPKPTEKFPAGGPLSKQLTSLANIPSLLEKKDFEQKISLPGGAEISRLHGECVRDHSRISPSVSISGTSNVHSSNSSRHQVGNYGSVTLTHQKFSPGVNSYKPVISLSVRQSNSGSALPKRDTFKPSISVIPVPANNACKKAGLVDRTQRRNAVPNQSTSYSCSYAKDTKFISPSISIIPEIKSSNPNSITKPPVPSITISSLPADKKNVPLQTLQKKFDKNNVETSLTILPSSNKFPVIVSTEATLKAPSLDEQNVDLDELDRDCFPNEVDKELLYSRRIIEPGKFIFNMLDRHVIINTQGSKLFKCDICPDLAYVRAFSLKRHYLREHINFQHICSRDISNCNIHLEEKTSLKGRKRKMKGTTNFGSVQFLKDPESQVEARKMGYYVTPFGELLRGVFQCHKCHEVFDTLKELKTHLQKHNNTIPIGNLLLNCPKCPEAFRSKKLLSDHLLDCHEQQSVYECIICHVRFASCLALKQHEHLHGPAFSKDTEYGQRNSLRCGKCGNKFQSAEEFRIHNISNCVSLSKLTFSCDICQKKFSLKAQLREHKMVHVYPNKYECEICYLEFTCKSALMQHEAMHGPMVKRSQGNNIFISTLPKAQNKQVEEPVEKMVNCCGICGHTFANYVELCRHTRIKHGKSKVFKNSELSHSSLERPKIMDTSIEIEKSDKKFSNVESSAAENLTSTIRHKKVGVKRPFNDAESVKRGPGRKSDGPKRRGGPYAVKVQESEETFYNNLCSKKCINYMDEIYLDGKLDSKLVKKLDDDELNKFYKEEESKRISWKNYQFPLSFKLPMEEAFSLDLGTQFTIYNSFETIKADSFESKQESVENSEQEIYIASLGLNEKNASSPRFKRGRKKKRKSSDASQIPPNCLSGDWVKPKIYFCNACHSKFNDVWDIWHHKYTLHNNVHCTHVEFEGSSFKVIPEEMYLNYNDPNGVYHAYDVSASSELDCSKCMNRYDSISDLHRHILECSGNTNWMNPTPKRSRTKGYNYRKKQRGRPRGMKRNIPNTPVMVKKRGYNKVVKDGSDTIEKMIANLPAKRVSRKIFPDHETSFKATVRRDRSTSLLPVENIEMVKENEIKDSKKDDLDSTTVESIEDLSDKDPPIKMIIKKGRVWTSADSETDSKKSLNILYTKKLRKKIIKISDGVLVKSKSGIVMGKHKTKSESNVGTDDLSDSNLKTKKRDSVQESVYTRTSKQSISDVSCMWCGSVFDYKSAMERHMKKCPMKAIKPESETKDVKTVRHSCPHCQKGFYYLTPLIKHINSCKGKLIKQEHNEMPKLQKEVCQQVEKANDDPPILPPMLEIAASNVKATNNISIASSSETTKKKKKSRERFIMKYTSKRRGRRKKTTVLQAMNNERKCMDKQIIDCQEQVDEKKASDVREKIQLERDIQEMIVLPKENILPDEVDAKLENDKNAFISSNVNILKVEEDQQVLEMELKYPNHGQLSLPEVSACKVTEEKIPQNKSCKFCEREFRYVGNLKKHMSVCAIEKVSKSVAENIEVDIKMNMNQAQFDAQSVGKSDGCLLEAVTEISTCTMFADKKEIIRTSNHFELDYAQFLSISNDVTQLSCNVLCNDRYSRSHFNSHVSDEQKFSENVNNSVDMADISLDVQSSSVVNLNTLSTASTNDYSIINIPTHKSTHIADPASSVENSVGSTVTTTHLITPESSTIVDLKEVTSPKSAPIKTAKSFNDTVKSKLHRYANNSSLYNVFQEDDIVMVDQCVCQPDEEHSYSLKQSKIDNVPDNNLDESIQDECCTAKCFNGSPNICNVSVGASPLESDVLSGFLSNKEHYKQNFTEPSNMNILDYDPPNFCGAFLELEQEEQFVEESIENLKALSDCDIGNADLLNRIVTNAHDGSIEEVSENPSSVPLPESVKPTDISCLPSDSNCGASFYNYSSENSVFIVTPAEAMMEKGPNHSECEFVLNTDIFSNVREKAVNHSSEWNDISLDPSSTIPNNCINDNFLSTDQSSDPSPEMSLGLIMNTVNCVLSDKEEDFDNSRLVLASIGQQLNQFGSKEMEALREAMGASEEDMEILAKLGELGKQNGSLLYGDCSEQGNILVDRNDTELKGNGVNQLASGSTFDYQEHLHSLNIGGFPEGKPIDRRCFRNFKLRTSAFESFVTGRELQAKISNALGGLLEKAFAKKQSSIKRSANATTDTIGKTVENKGKSPFNSDDVCSKKSKNTKPKKKVIRYEAEKLVAMLSPDLKPALHSFDRLSFKCQVCSALFMGQSNLNRHMGLCHKGYASVNKEDIHGIVKKMYSNPQQCPLCKEHFGGFGGISRHLSTKHKDWTLEKFVKDNVACWKLIHSLDKSKMITVAMPRIENFECTVSDENKTIDCEDETSNQEKGLENVEEYHCDNGFLCSLCGLTFVNTLEATAHIKDEHGKEENDMVVELIASDDSLPSSQAGSSKESDGQEEGVIASPKASLLESQDPDKIAQVAMAQLKEMTVRFKRKTSRGWEVEDDPSVCIASPNSVISLEKHRTVLKRKLELSSTNKVDAASPP